MTRAVGERGPRWPEAGEVLVATAAACLLTTTWIVPTEGALDGETGWRALSWMLVACVWSAVRTGRARLPESDLPADRTAALAASRPTDHRSWRLLDVAAVLVVTGQVASGLSVLATSGQKRFAANLLLEWLGLAATWWVLRGLLERRAWREAITAPLLAAVIAAAGLGIWQHYVALPRMAAELGPQLARIRAGELSPALVSSLTAAGIPLTEPGLTLFEKRLVDSREPFGMFALANTLGGLLAASLLWLVAAAWISRSAAEPGHSTLLPRTWLIVGILAGLMAWCLMLTKSRTAVVGLLTGSLYLCTAWFSTQRSLRKTPARRGPWLAVIALAIGAAAGLPVLVATGVWDAQVLLEAPKSLLYRWRYWVGGFRLILERPLWGAGLGQFRSEYLRVKLPEASEEIADPHNLWIDAGVNGGLISLCGLLLGTWWLTRHLARTACTSSQSPPSTLPGTLQGNQNRELPANGPAVPRVVFHRSACIGSAAAFAVVFGLTLSEGNWDDRVLALGLMWAIAVWICGRMPDLGHRLSQGLPAVTACFCLFVHLHGAGGFEMPAVMTWLGFLALLSLRTTEQSDTFNIMSPTPAARFALPFSSVAATSWNRWLFVCSMSALTLAAGLFLWWPGARSGQLLNQASGNLAGGRVETALRQLRAAAAVDAWNPEPWRQLAELHVRDFQMPSNAGGWKDRDSAALALGAFHEARRRDPANPHLLERMGDVHAASYEQSRSTTEIAKAASAYSQAHAAYPTNATIAMKWARAAAKSGDAVVARQAAVRALRQDDFNRSLGHVERWLSDTDREELREVAQHIPSNREP